MEHYVTLGLLCAAMTAAMAALMHADYDGSIHLVIASLLLVVNYRLSILEKDRYNRLNERGR